MRTFVNLIMLIGVFGTAFAVTDNGNNVSWTMVFQNTKPVSEKISQKYCDDHIPSVLVTTVNQITSKNGIKSLNGINVRYTSYKSANKDNLYFNVANALLEGSDNNTKWAQKLKIYEQTLDGVGTTYAVWSTANCKGSLTEYPTVIK